MVTQTAFYNEESPNADSPHHDRLPASLDFTGNASLRRGESTAEEHFRPRTPDAYRQPAQGAGRRSGAGFYPAGRIRPAIRLSQFRGQKNVVLSFVPAAWTPVCSGQWPGYNLVKDLFNVNDTVMLGITVDNIPTLHAWTREMGGLWFDVLSDFWPHGAVADAYGVLRSDGTAERALIFIDKQGIISSAMVFDINERPDLKLCVDEVEKLGQP
jgi:peroxiredoxin